jgi:hypothetical protein
MMEQKKLTLDSYPGYLRVLAAVQKLRAEKAESSTRIEQILQELSQPREQQIDAAQAWAQALEGRAGYKYATDNRSELRDELGQLEGRLRFIDQALTIGEVELDKARGQASLEICAAVRGEWVAAVGRALEHLKGVSEANQALDIMRADLERDGVVTGSLPYSKFDLGGEWNSPHGGRVVGYQRETAENFPELASAADQGIKLKLKALNERERKFDRRLEEGAEAGE